MESNAWARARAPDPEINSLEDIKQLFPPSVRDEVKFGQANGTWWIRGPYLGREAFARVTDAIKGLGGRWVPRGKSSRWELPQNGGELHG